MAKYGLINIGSSMTVDADNRNGLNVYNSQSMVEPKHYRGAGGILSNKLQAQPNERDRSL